MKQTLFIPGVMPSLNQVIEAAKGAGGRGANYYRMKDQLTNSVMILARAAKLKPMRCAHFSYVFREPHNRRDPSNIFIAVKFIEDGLVAAKVFEDDGWQQVLSIKMDFKVVEKKDVGVYIEMWDGAS